MTKLKVKFFTRKHIALLLYKYFTCEKNRNKLYRSISDPFKRTKHVLDISDRTLNRWIAKDNEEHEVHEEYVKRGAPVKFDSFDRDLIGRTVGQMMNDNNYVTLKTLKSHLKHNHDMNINKQTLWRIVRSLGFTFKKSKTCKDLICESKNMVALRAKYLRKLKELRADNNCDIYFLDESYINAHHTCNKEWQSETQQRVIPTGKGKRLIIAHIGSYEKGLIPNGELIFESKSKDENGDYHKDMDSNEFEKWICDTVVPRFDKKSCIVMDNAPYHNVTNPEDKVPKMYMKKADIIAWLDKHDIDHSICKTKKQLLEVVNASEISKTQVFRIDRYLQDRGHVPLRLPPYHPQLNPIELIWAEMKKHVALANTTFKLKDIKQHTKDALSSISKEYWQKCERHVRTIEEKYWAKDGLDMPQQAKVVISLDSMDTTDSEL